ncbi:fimbrial protein, partial [Clostridioides difficile]|nr:fimbrial protein [Clostridioides difficile]
RAHSVDAMNAPSANNETQAGHTIVSTNQKD